MWRKWPKFDTNHKANFYVFSKSLLQRSKLCNDIPRRWHCSDKIKDQTLKIKLVCACHAIACAQPVSNVDQGNNGSDNENEGAERLLNLNWCLCGSCKVRKTARECVCWVEEPESENKLEGTLSTSNRIRRVLLLFFDFFFVIFAGYEILYNNCYCVCFFFSFFCEFYHRGDYAGGPLQKSQQWGDRNKHTTVLLSDRTFCPGHCFAKFFLFTGKRWQEIPFLPSLWDLFEQYGAEQKALTAKGRVVCSSFQPNFRLNSMTSRNHFQAAEYIPRWRRPCTIFRLLWTKIS